MKKIILIISLVICLALSGCSKDDKNVPNVSEGELLSDGDAASDINSENFVADMGNGESDNRKILSRNYALPELPDVVVVGKQSSDDGGASYLLVDGESFFKLPGKYLIRRSVQLAEDGTIAIGVEDYEDDDGVGKILIYRDEMQIGEIPGPVDSYFYLCGSGEKIAYGTNEYNSYLWDISNGKSTLVSDDHDIQKISYDGSMLIMQRFYSKNGEALEEIALSSEEDLYIQNISPDGEYIYYGKRSAKISSDGARQYYFIFGVMINGDSHDLFNYSAPDYDLWSDYNNYCPKVIACSQNYREVLFTFKDDIYYFSMENIADTGFEAQYVGNASGGMLLSLDMATTANSISGYISDDAVSAWRNHVYGSSTDNYSSSNRGDIYYNNVYQYREQKSIQNNVFCLMKEQNGTRTVSLVKLVDNQLMELIPNITGNICLSADETKLWCVADGRLAFCDLADESPSVDYCDTAYVREYIWQSGQDNGIIKVETSGVQEPNMTAWTAPIAATSDGETACFIGVDGSFWICTPDTIHNPQFIIDNAFWVQCSVDDEFYLMKGNYTGHYNESRACDLYLVGTDGRIDYQYGDVVDIYMTKSDVYIAVAKESDIPYYPSNFYGEITCALYCKKEDGYKLICDSYELGYKHFLWWG